MGRAADSTNRYRRAWQAGRDGHPMPSGLSELADSDPKIDDAFAAGQAGEAFPGGPAPTPAPTKRQPTSLDNKINSTIPRPRISPAHDGASVVLGLFLLAMVISVLDYGPTGPLLWFKAKFLNQPTAKGSTNSQTKTSATTGNITNVNGLTLTAVAA